jgi:NAD(P)H-quinone oxidoreductase subunit 5
MGDVCLLLVLIVIYHEFHTWDFQAVFNASDVIRNSAGGQLSLSLQICCYLLVTAALLKSAQFPFHSWLPDTMETPTPVSALMHAGVINAGGFLIVRLSPLITLCPGALAVLTLLGGFTALFASLTMLTHASVKRALAFSTVAQMGFMMLECGLGAFSLATLHLVAHSLYKAHAFLSSGSMIALAKAKWVPVARPQAHPGVLLASVLLALVVTWGASGLLGFLPQDDPSYSLLVLILLLSQAYMLWNLLSSSLRLSLLFWGVLMGTGLSLVYFALHRLFIWVLKASVHDQVYTWTDYHICAGLAVMLLFFAVLFFQTELPQWEQNQGYKTLYVHARNGFYFNTLANHLVTKIWPRTRPVASHQSQQT